MRAAFTSICRPSQVSFLCWYSATSAIAFLLYRSLWFGKLDSDHSDDWALFLFVVPETVAIFALAAFIALVPLRFKDMSTLWATAIPIAILTVPFWLLITDHWVHRLIGDHVLSLRVAGAIRMLPAIVGSAPEGAIRSAWLHVLSLATVSIVSVLVASKVSALMPIVHRRMGSWLFAIVVIAVVARTCVIYSPSERISVQNQYLPFAVFGMNRASLSVADARMMSAEFSSAQLDASTNDGDSNATENPLGDQARDQRLRRIRLMQPIALPEDPPDILIVVVESFRHELVTVETMPSLTAAAKKGIWCRRHFSGGNATSHGVFSLLTGMEATWFDEDLRFRPPLWSLLAQAGYQLGFFAGHDDWRAFLMDGLVGEQHFDQYRTRPQNGLESDRRAIQDAIDFLEPGDRRDSAEANRESKNRPKLALLYLYATHAPYRSYPADQRFTPAADERFLIPYSRVDAPQVWNRYRNAASTVDRWLGILIDRFADDVVMAVVGDHGESFYDDGAIGHGTRISAAQNMTPMVLIGPGVPSKLFDDPTSHADFLPTLMSVIDAEVGDLGVLDGISLMTAESRQLRSRLIRTRDYLSTALLDIREL